LKVWAVSVNQSADVAGVTNDPNAYNNALGIGLGFKYSDAIVAQNGVYNASTNNYAAGAARAYAGNSKSDWYLPTTAELNLLCQWNRGVTQNVTIQCSGGALNTGTGVNGGFRDNTYWSSSEVTATNAWNQSFSPGGNGAQGSGIKSNSGHVRPVRAF
jgi:hypothetical protein